jgi:hypothetical protein
MFMNAKAIATLGVFASVCSTLLSGQGQAPPLPPAPANPPPPSLQAAADPGYAGLTAQ